MTQLVYYEPDGPDWGWWSRPAGPRPDSRWDIETRHGYTLRDIHNAVGIALSRNIGVSALSRADRYDAAWSAIVTTLYQADNDAPPEMADLAYAGWAAIADAYYLEMRHHGRDHTRNIGQERKSFAQYWTPLPASTWEERTVERMAVHQIWPLLTPGQQEALTAFALHGSASAAAAALGKNVYAVHALLRSGRRRFEQAWFEGETPQPRRGRDRRSADGGPVSAQEGYRAARRAMRRRGAVA